MKDLNDIFTIDEIREKRREYLEAFEDVSFTDYIRKEKIQRMKKIPTPLFPIDDYFYNPQGVSPYDMDFELQYITNSTQLKQFQEMLEITSSHLLEQSYPGKSLKVIVLEKNSKQIAGFIRIGSPTLNMGPRNKVLRTTESGLIHETLPNAVNKHILNGQVIVPAQPFGFNYAAGKLMALMCCSHEIREKLDSMYGMETMMFETTSLYGSIKSQSMYDGLKPFLRSHGQTDSDFVPHMPARFFRPLRKWFEEKLQEPLVNTDQGSIKMKQQRRIESIILNILKEKGTEEEVKEWKDNLQYLVENMNTKKNYYYTFYGFENAADYIMGRSKERKKSPNFDRFYMENLVDWWRKKADNRYQKLQQEGRFRDKLEIWTDKDTQKNIDIVR
jgi:hypothetical protein